MKNNFSLFISKSAYFLALTLIVGLVLLLVPLTDNFVIQTKNFLIFIGGIVTAFLFFLKSLKRQSWKIILSPLTIPFLLFGASTLASTFFTNQYPVKSLLDLGGIYAASTVIVLLLGSLFSLKKKQRNYVVNTLAISASILSVAQLLQLVGIGPSKLINQILGTNIPNNLLFNLAGSNLISLQIFILALVGSIVQITSKKNISNLHIITIPMLLFGLGISLWAILPGKETSITLPPFNASWSVMLDSFRSPRAALIGQGPANYMNTYMQYKPIWVNGQNYWQVNFSASKNHLMTLAVTTGLLGLATWIFVIIKFFQTTSLKKILAEPVIAMIAVSFIFQLLLPGNAVILAIQAVLIAFWTASKHKVWPAMKLEALSMTISVQKDLHKVEKKPKNWLISMINTLFLVAIAYLTFLTGKAYASFHHLYQAAMAANNNQVIEVYNHQRLARNLNPYLDSIHRAYASTNMQIAVALSNKADLTDQEKNQISQLIQQAINEARNATVLDPSNTANWLTLAEIYRNLIGTAEGADQWTVNSYVAAIEKDPTNPFTRIDLGGVFFSQEQYQQAASIFQQAINIKPDIPTAYYQLSRVLIKTNNYDAAKQTLERTLSLLPTDSQDYATVNKDLQEISRLVEEASQAGTLQDNQVQQDNSQLQTNTQTTPLGTELDSITNQNLQDPTSGLTKPVENTFDPNQEVNIDQDANQEKSQSGLSNEELLEATDSSVTE